MMRKFLAILFVLLLAAAITGCKSAGTAPKTSDDSQVPSYDDEPAAEAEADSEESSGLVGEFEDFVTKRLSLKYTVAYDITGKSQGSDTSYQMTQYFGGTDKFRMDSANSGIESRTYLMDDNFYSCTNQGGKWMCISMPNQGDSPTQQFDDIAEKPDNYKITPDGTKSIAGTTAKCYKIVTPTGTVRECFSKEGVPLYMETTFQGGSMTMQATSYKASVKESDFDLPAEPQDMQAMIAAQTGGQAPAEDEEDSDYVATARDWDTNENVNAKLGCEACDGMPAAAKQTCLAACS